MHVGADVIEGFTEAEAQTKAKTNIFAFGFEEGERVSVGASLKGRVWSYRVAPTLKHWVDWCDHVGPKVAARPVVATRVGGHQDQIEHRRNGLLIDADSPRALAAAIDELLCDPAEGLCLAAAGRERVRERFLADRDFIAHTHLLVELLANRG